MQKQQLSQDPHEQQGGGSRFNRENIIALLFEYRILVILLLMIVGLSLASDVFLTSRNIINIIRQISVNAVLASGMTFVIITGGIDLSVGSIVAVGGVIVASIIKPGSAPIWLAILAALAACSVLGFVNGITIAKLKVPPFVITLSMMTIARGIAYVYTDGRPIVALPKSFLFLGRGTIGFLPVPVVIMLLVVIIAGVLLYFTTFGRYVYYIGGNEEAARVSGINIVRVKTLVYAFNGLLAGLGGVMLAARINSGQPQAGMMYELDAIAAVVIGGTSLSGGLGTITGTLAGALIIGIINNGLNLLNVSPFYQMIVKGFVIAFAVILDVRASRSKA